MTVLDEQLAAQILRNDRNCERLKLCVLAMAWALVGWWEGGGALSSKKEFAMFWSSLTNNVFDCVCLLKSDVLGLKGADTVGYPKHNKTHFIFWTTSCFWWEFE